MVVTRSGAAGHGAVGHAQEELNVALVHAPILRLQTEEETVADKEKLWNLENVITTTAQIFKSMEVTRSGATGGLIVAEHVEEELSNVLVHAPISPRQQIMEGIAMDQIK
ncbi:hypothetical protein ACROYT_G032348 [Oculina patagonica]